MNKWQDVFTVRMQENHPVGESSYWNWDEKYELIENSTGLVLRTYNDRKYAIKQAKHRFKKIIKKVEQSLLS